MRAAVAMVVILGLAGPAWADAGRTLTLALYAPTAPLASAEARFAYVEKLAQQLQQAGIAVQGRAFARATDLEGALRHGQIDLAILDALYLAERNASYPVLATATAGGETALRWGLYTSSPKTSLMALSGTTLAWTQVGKGEPAYIDNVMLDGELKAGQFFSLRPPAPDVMATVSDVVLRRADCVFAPEAAVAGKNLRRVFDAGRVPNPALVLVQPRLPRELVNQIQRAVVAASTVGGLDGWRAGGGDAIRQLRQRLGGRAARRLVMAEPQPLLTAVRSEFVAQGREEAPALPPLRGLLQAPLTVP